MSNPFGFYAFDELIVGETYILSVNHKQFVFSPDSQVLTITESIENVNFEAQYGMIRTAETNQFGYYRFDDVEAGQTYIFSVSHKTFQFAISPQVIFVQEELSELNFTADP